MRTLENVNVVSLALRLPGPLAVARLRDLGASVTKVEPPEGDPLRQASPAWYRDLHGGVQVETLDLKVERGRAALEPLLSGSDLLLTSSRPATLDRLGLGWQHLGRRHPRLCHVAVVGHEPPGADHPGHDLTYQAEAGLLSPPRMPKVLVADVGGALEVVNAALALLLQRERHGPVEPSQRETVVALAGTATFFAGSVHHGLTDASGVLGGTTPRYGLYPTRQGWIALAAIEDPIWSALERALELTNPDRAALENKFGDRTAEEWEVWARHRALPISAVR